MFVDISFYSWHIHQWQSGSQWNVYGHWLLNTPSRIWKQSWRVPVLRTSPQHLYRNENNEGMYTSAYIMGISYRSLSYWRPKCYFTISHVRIIKVHKANSSNAKHNLLSFERKISKKIFTECGTFRNNMDLFMMPFWNIGSQETAQPKWHNFVLLKTWIPHIQGTYFK